MVEGWYLGKNVARLLEERPKILGRRERTSDSFGAGYLHQRRRPEVERHRLTGEYGGLNEQVTGAYGIGAHGQRTYDMLPERVKQYAASVSKTIGKPLDQVMGSRPVREYYRKMYGASTGLC